MVKVAFRRCGFKIRLFHVTQTFTSFLMARFACTGQMRIGGNLQMIFIGRLSRGWQNGSYFTSFSLLRENGLVPKLLMLQCPKYSKPKLGNQKDVDRRGPSN